MDKKTCYDNADKEYTIGAKYVSMSNPQLGELMLVGVTKGDSINSRGFFVFHCPALKMSITSDLFGVFPKDFVEVVVEQGPDAFFVIVDERYEGDFESHFHTSYECAVRNLDRLGREHVGNSAASVRMVGPVKPGQCISSAPLHAKFDVQKMQVVVFAK